VRGRLHGENCSRNWSKLRDGGELTISYLPCDHHPAQTIERVALARVRSQRDAAESGAVAAERVHPRLVQTLKINQGAPFASCSSTPATASVTWPTAVLSDVTSVASCWRGLAGSAVFVTYRCRTRGNRPHPEVHHRPDRLVVVGERDAAVALDLARRGPLPAVDDRPMECLPRSARRADRGAKSTSLPRKHAQRPARR
jgi:hypothetical protein